MSRKLKLINRKFGRWTVVGNADSDSRGQSQWLCRCICGNERVVNGSNLTTGLTVSCGCYKIERTKETKTKNIVNGKHYTKRDSTYSCWCVIRRRCRDKNFIDYKYYGDRGINVCERWMKFENFLADMGEKPNGLTIDRIDNNKGYSPENCRWANITTQNNNQRRCTQITFSGKTQTIGQWAAELQIKYLTLYGRIKYYKWPIKRALTEPIRTF